MAPKKYLPDILRSYLGAEIDLAHELLLLPMSPTASLDKFAGRVPNPDHFRLAASTSFFERTGERIYVVPPNFSRTLAVTDMGRVTEPQVVVPAGTIYVDLPDSQWHGVRTDREDVQLLGCLVTGGGRGLEVILVYGDHSTGHARIHFMPGETVQAAIDRANQSMVSSPTLHDRPEALQRARELTQEVTSMLVSLLIYLECENAKLRSSDPVDAERRRIKRGLATCRSRGGRKRLRAELADLRGQKRTRVVYVGEPVEDRIASLQETARQSGPRRGPTKHVVRAHFHTFWCGTGRTRKEIKFIGPYIKGEDEPDRTITKLREEKR